MKTCYVLLFISLLWLPTFGGERPVGRLILPRHEQLSSQRITHVIQDAEGFLWYATEGGGVGCDDGCKMTVFRSDADHPDLLCSNKVACIAEAAGRYIIIGTYHGANLLDKRDYSIRRLKDVDDKRVDDIIIGHNGHWWLTANKKIYEYSADGRLLGVYPGGDKYIFRLHEDEQGRLWGMEWEGGLLKLERGRLVSVPAEWPDTVNFTRTSMDRQGRQLVVDIDGNSYALAENGQHLWFEGKILTRPLADSVRIARGLSARPTAFTEKQDGELWFSSGKDIRCMKKDKETVVLPQTKDVSAMVFTKDGTLWLATIFGTLMTYRDGKLATDDYASNEYGDAVVALETDSLGRLVIVCERYVRLYDYERHTLCQQSIENENVYLVELQETLPGKRWSKPDDKVVERMPWWILLVFGMLLLILTLLIVYIWQLHRQRGRFLSAMTQQVASSEQQVDSQSADVHPMLSDEWLLQAIALVEIHLGDEGYSVERLASDLCVSRMTFYRKIQSATGQKPTEFIRTIRLRRAADLLREGNMTVTEISYATGFSSVSYFSRCFRTLFGMPPTKYGRSTS